MPWSSKPDHESKVSFLQARGGLRKEYSFWSFFIFVLTLFSCQVPWNNPSIYKGVTTTVSYTVTFEANFPTSGGSGTMGTQTIDTGATANLNANKFTLTGYPFTGWNTKADGTGTGYSDGESFKMGTSNVTLYAQWTIITVPVSSVSVSLAGSSSVSANLGDTLQLTVSISPANATNQTVTWSVSGATNVSVSTSGFVTVGSTASGTATITATSTDGGHVGAFTVIIVIPQITGGQLTGFTTQPTGAYTISNSATSIAGAAFQSAASMTSVTIPSTVTNIGPAVGSGAVGAFAGLASLTTVTFSSPSNVTTIGDNAFKNTGLTSVTIPGSVTSVGGFVFYECYSLTTATLQSGALTVSNSMFERCTSLMSVTIPSSVTTIGSNAFSLCVALTSVTMGSATPPATLGANCFTTNSSGTGVAAGLIIHVPTSAAVTAYIAALNAVAAGGSGTAFNTSNVVTP